MAAQPGRVHGPSGGAQCEFRQQIDQRRTNWRQRGLRPAGRCPQCSPPPWHCSMDRNKRKWDTANRGMNDWRYRNAVALTFRGHSGRNLQKKPGGRCGSCGVVLACFLRLALCMKIALPRACYTRDAAPPENWEKCRSWDCKRSPPLRNIIFISSINCDRSCSRPQKKLKMCSPNFNRPILTCCVCLPLDR